VRLGNSQQSKRYLSAHARSPAAAQFHERHPLSTRLLASATACSQPRSTHSSSHLLSSTPLQQRSFGTGKPAVPIHETPHYMDYDTLVDMHLVTRQGFGDRPLFGTKVDGKYKWITYRDFGKKVDACRNALASIGISQGDTVACISKNREEWAVCAYATYTLGAIFVPMYEEQLLKDWEYIIADAGAKALLVSTKVRRGNAFTRVF
jgi:AMP-binding enzyme